MDVLLNSLNSKNFEVRNRSEEREKIPAKSKKNLMKLRCCVTLQCDQTDVGSSQKTFLAFSRTSKRRRWPKLSTKKLYFLFWLYSETNFAFRRKRF